MNEKNSQQSMSAEKKRKTATMNNNSSSQKGGGSSQKKSRVKSLSPSALEEGRSEVDRIKQGPPGRYGEQVEYDISTKD